MLDIFEILGPIMVGPSSSHGGSCAIRRMARTLLGEPPVKADIGLYGSLCGDRPGPRYGPGAGGWTAGYEAR